MRIILLLCVLVSGCATSTYFKQNPPNEKEALVYFIRKRAEPTAWQIYVFVDGQQAASLANASYTRFSVPAGRRSIRLEWASFMAGGADIKNTDFDFRGNDSRYFLIEGSTSVGAYNYSQTTRLSEISPVHGEMLVRELDNQ
ncbi:DUF2846 domain-containing protein [Archangium gephyra]|uniref:hypothetical protein n=1 Tax=Archangium gephyra TaxID=48 RepID=UPI0035D4BF1F